MIKTMTINEATRAYTRITGYDFVVGQYAVIAQYTHANGMMTDMLMGGGETAAAAEDEARRQREEAGITDDGAELITYHIVTAE